MKPPPFRYASPTTVQEAVELLSRSDGTAQVLAGGQSLIPLLRRRLIKPEQLVDLRRIGQMHELSFDGNGFLGLGAMVTHQALGRWATSHHQDLLNDAAGHIGNRSVRTMGTVVGSLAHADPSAEWAAVALVLEGVCQVAGPDGDRQLGVGRLFAGPFLNTLKPSEFITRLTLALPDSRSGAAFAEVSPRHGDPAVAGAAVVLTVEDSYVESARVGLIGLAPTPRRARSVEAALTGCLVSECLVSDCIDAAVESLGDDIEPLGDIHGSEEYRRMLAPVVVSQALRSGLGRAIGKRS